MSACSPKLEKSVCALLLASLPVLLTAPEANSQSVTFDIIAENGDAAPDTNGNNGTFATIVNNPTLNNAGQVAFRSTIAGTSGGTSDDQGIFRGSALAGPVQIVREGQPAPDGDGKQGSFGDFAINDAGQVMFLAFGMTETAGTDRGIFVGDGLGATAQVARLGQAAPDGNGSYTFFIEPAINSAGQLAFHGQFTSTTSGGNSDDTGLFLGSGVSGPIRIAREGQPAPDANGNFNSLSNPSINAASQVAYVAGISGGTNDGTAIFINSGGTNVQVIRDGQVAPDNNGSFAAPSIISSIPINNNGKVGFIWDLTGTSGGTTDDSGVFFGDAGGITQIVRAGQAAPDSNGSFSSFVDTNYFNNGNLKINDAGQVVFTAEMTGTSGATGATTPRRGSPIPYDSTGLFIGDGSAGPVQIARGGDTALDGNGLFISFSGHTLNQTGQSAFTVTLTGTAGGKDDDNAIYFYDPLTGLIQVAREGDSFLGSTITSLGFNSGESGFGTEGNGLNDQGQITYVYTLADGRQGVALATIAVPEPGSLALFCVLGALGMRRRR